MCCLSATLLETNMEPDGEEKNAGEIEIVNYKNLHKLLQIFLYFCVRTAT